MAVAERNGRAVQLLLDAGADPELRTRIDDYETPQRMAEAAGLLDLAAILAAKAQPLRRRLRAGLTLIAEVPGGGDFVRRQHTYRIRLRMWLHKGEPVRWREAEGWSARRDSRTTVKTMITVVRIDRSSLVNGLFYGVDGMRVAACAGSKSPRTRLPRSRGSRRHPAGSVLTAEITIVALSE
jgi:hypothetical protein